MAASAVNRTAEALPSERRRSGECWQSGCGARPQRPGDEEKSIARPVQQRAEYADVVDPAVLRQVGQAEQDAASAPASSTSPVRSRPARGPPVSRQVTLREQQADRDHGRAHSRRSMTASGRDKPSGLESAAGNREPGPPDGKLVRLPLLPGIWR